MNQPLVPTIDFEPFLKGGAKDRMAVAEQIDCACIETGFFAITGHGVDEAKIEDVRAAAVRFFALPEADKQAVARPESRVSRGWYPVADRSLAYSLGKETPPDLQESYAIGPLEVPNEPYFTCERAGMFFAPNLWPASQPDLQTAMTGYFRVMEQLAHAVMQAFALALGQQKTHFDGKIDRHTSSLRLIRYPGQVEAASNQRRAGEHTDYGSFTILRGDNLPGGLQVKLRHGNWTDIIRPDRGFICNIGDAMARWTNDRWVSTLHRVGVPPNYGPAEDRISIVFFHNPNYDAEIRSITAANETSKYLTETFDAYYINKLARGSFGKPDTVLETAPGA